MRKNRFIGQDRCYHLVSRLAHRAFFLDDEEKDRVVALMRRVEEFCGVVVLGGSEGLTLMVGFGWCGCAKLWYNVRHEAVAQLQDQPVLPSDQPHCQPRVLPE